jgi:hypothetical protein
MHHHQGTETTKQTLMLCNAVRHSAHLLLCCIACCCCQAPDADGLERFLGRLPLVMNVVIMSPHGYFGQSNVLGLPDTGGQVGGDWPWPTSADM